MTNISNYQALRTIAAGIKLNESKTILKVSGADATDFLNAVLPSKIYYLQSYTSLNSVLLDKACTIVDLVQIISVDEFYFWVGSKSQKELTLNFLAEQKDEKAVQIEDLDEQIFMYSVEGPYAWKRVGDAFGNEIHGLRIHGAMPIEVSGSSGIVIRSGQSGEYAYRFILPASAREIFFSKINERDVLPEANNQDILLASQETRTPCFGGSIMEGDSPFEQDLRYMIDFEKTEFVYHSEIQASLSETKKGVIAMKTNKYDVKVGDDVFLGDILVGKVLSIGHSPRVGSMIGFLKIDQKYAHPGIDQFSFQDGLTLETLSSPVIQTLSASVAIE
jgi:glycine cleavage system aminomethyltransferase T